MSSCFRPVFARKSTRLLIAWNAGTSAYLALIALMMGRRGADPEVQARPEDENQWVLLLLGVVAASAAFAAIIWELGPMKAMVGIPRASTSCWSSPASSAPGFSSR